MAAGNWIMYDDAKEQIGLGNVNFDTDSFIITLHTNTYTPNRSTQTIYTDLTNELTTQFGYTQKNEVLANPSWVDATGTLTWDSDDPSWTASGGSIGPFRIAVIHDDTMTSPVDGLICYNILDTADITATDGDTITIQMSGSGILTFSGAIS